jgi:hypothetical protein
MNTHDDEITSQSEKTNSQVWEPESPFLSDPIPRENPPVSAAVAFGPQSEIESPFTSEYALDGEVVPSYKAVQFARLHLRSRDKAVENLRTGRLP